MAQTVLSNSKGVTLIELMISTVILLIVSLALMKTSIIGMKTNVQNELRDEAVNIAEMRMNQLRNVPFPTPPVVNDLTATIAALDSQVTKTFRGFTATYTPRRTVTDLTTVVGLPADSKQVTMSVSWVYSGQTFIHTVTTILRKQ